MIQEIYESTEDFNELQEDIHEPLDNIHKSKKNFYELKEDGREPRENFHELQQYSCDPKEVFQKTKMVHEPRELFLKAREDIHTSKEGAHEPGENIQKTKEDAYELGEVFREPRKNFHEFQRYSCETKEVFQKTKMDAHELGENSRKLKEDAREFPGESPFSRSQMLLGWDAMEKLSQSRVAVFGLGGVGGYVCEGLVRGGVGAFDLIDRDRVCLSNLNRQIIATYQTLGQYKTEAMRDRILAIRPDAVIRVYPCFVTLENIADFPFADYDYVVDAVDTVTAKIALVLTSQRYGVPVISCMGAGNKLDGSRFRVADLYETKNCPLARVMRKELKKRGVKSLKVVYSEEDAIRPQTEAVKPQAAKTDRDPANSDRRVKPTPGSVSFVPSIAGLLCAGEVIKDLIRTPGRHNGEL